MSAPCHPRVESWERLPHDLEEAALMYEEYLDEQTTSVAAFLQEAAAFQAHLARTNTAPTLAALNATQAVASMATIPSTQGARRHLDRLLAWSAFLTRRGVYADDPLRSLHRKKVEVLRRKAVQPRTWEAGILALPDGDPLRWAFENPQLIIENGRIVGGRFAHLVDHETGEVREEGQPSI